MITTLCWHCDRSYPMAECSCPRCGATNPNVDLDRASKEALGEVEIEMPALLREQAA
jgi:Zn finger protein HypA/HybF involved in hydrogenase expression